TATQCFAPQNAASASSSSLTSGPRMNWQCANTRSSRTRRSAAMRACCAFRSRNGMAGCCGAVMRGISLSGSGAHFAGGAIGVVGKFGDQTTEEGQRKPRLTAAARSGNLVHRASDNCRVRGAGCCHQQARVAGRYWRLLPVKQLLVQLFPRAEAGETNFYIHIRMQSSQPNDLPCEIRNLHRRPHLEHEDAAVAYGL